MIEQNTSTQSSSPSSNSDNDDALLSALLSICKLLHSPHSAESLTAGLPLVDHKLTPQLFIRAAERAGFSSRLVNRPIEKISNLVLPAVLLLKENKTCVLVSKNNDDYKVILPETGDGEKNLSIEDHRYWGWKSIVKTCGNLLCLLVFLGVFHIAFTAYHDRNLISRTIYALNKTHDLKIQTEEFHIHYKHYPENETELSEFSQIAYPDGGGARLENGGAIRIWFDVLPELKNGDILLTPDKPINDAPTQWTCTSSHIKKQWLPRHCRPYST